MVASPISLVGLSESVLSIILTDSDPSSDPCYTIKAAGITLLLLVKHNQMNVIAPILYWLCNSNSAANIAAFIAPCKQACFVVPYYTKETPRCPLTSLTRVLRVLVVCFRL